MKETTTAKDNIMIGGSDGVNKFTVGKPANKENSTYSNGQTAVGQLCVEKIDESKLTTKEAEIIFNQFSSLQIQTNTDDFLEAAMLIDSIKRKMKMQIESDVEKV